MIVRESVSADASNAWRGELPFLFWQLVVRDFRIRYRNMSLGLLWSILNPLVMMGLWTYVFTQIFRTQSPHYSIQVLSAIIPFNFFTMALLNSTVSIQLNESIVKRIPIRREVIPLAAIFSHVIHVLIQFALLAVFVVADGILINENWLWLPLVWGLEVIFLIGLGLFCSAVYVFVKDMRYVVESFNVVLFWIVPVVYSFQMVPPEMKDLYQYNPVAALIMASHNVILEARAPGTVLLWKLAFVSFLSLALGYWVFRRLEPHFYERL